MTFYEAALRVLEEAGTPLPSGEITRRAQEKGLLSHIGKLPELTMLARLAAMARRPRDRRVQVTARDTFALTDWLLPEDAEALAQTGLPTPNPEEGQAPYRTNERHPEARAEFLRTIGRQAERLRRRDDDGKKKKFPPVPEVAFEVLTDARTALTPQELLARLRARELVDELNLPALFDALAEDNQRRIDQGRRPNFAAVRAEGGELQLSAEQSTDGPTSELQAAFCKACGLNFEGGRWAPRAATSERRPALPVAEEAVQLHALKAQLKEARRESARALRRRLAVADPGTLEKAVVKMLHALHFRELKVAKRGKDGPLLTARRRDGSLELRYAIRLAKAGLPVERRDVSELRRDLASCGANLGLLVSTGEARGEARGEAVSGGPLVALWCGDGLAEKFLEAEVGVLVTRLELFEVDEAFFEQARVDAEESQRRRDERRQERDRGRGDGAASPPPPPAEALQPTDAEVPPVSPPVELGAEDLLEAGAEGADEGDEGEEGEGPDEEGEGAPGTGAPGTEEGQKRRRRRRRRRRRGGQRLEGGAPGQPGQAAPAEGAEAGGSPPPPAAEAAPPPPTQLGPSGEGGEGSTA